MERRWLLLITLFGFIGLIISDSIAEDAIWITNSSSDTVTKLNTDGTTIGTFVVGGGPHAIAVDGSGKRVSLQ